MKITTLVLGFGAVLAGQLAIANCVDYDAQQALTQRFKVNHELVLDTKTQLTWQRCSVGTTWSADNSCRGEVDAMSLSAAKKLAQSLNDGWRVPTIHELYSLVEPQCRFPAINSAAFPSIQETDEGAPYWTVSTVEEIPILFYFVDFWEGNADGHSNDFSLAVRLVRG